MKRPELLKNKVFCSTSQVNQPKVRNTNFTDNLFNVNNM